MIENILNAYLPGSIILVLLMFLLWLTQVFTKNAAVIDIGWALGLPILTASFAFQLEGYLMRKLIILLIITFWALRLSFHLSKRILKDKKEDARYSLLRKDWQPFINFKFLLLFEFESILDFALAIPFFLICANQATNFAIVEILGILVWIGAFLGEITADEQLKQFRNNPENKGKVCQEGLWNYSRHPNYFFEWTMWIGYALMAMAAPYGWLGIIGPAIMLHLLLNVTGVPFAETMSLKSRGDLYKEYQKTTSIFIPLPKKG